MKVVMRTDDRLVLRPSREALFLILIGAVVLLVGGGVGTWLSTRTVITCNRVASGRTDCLIERRLLGQTIWERRVPGVYGARLDERRDSDGDFLYRAVLLAEEGDVPLTLAWSSGRANKAEAVAQVDAFVGRESTDGLVWATGEPGAKIVLGVCAALGIIMIAFGVYALRTTWTVDRSRGVLVRQSGGLFRRRTVEYELSDVVDVRVARSSGGDGNTYRSEILLGSGKVLPLLPYYSSGYRAKAETVALLRGFLGLAESQEDGTLAPDPTVDGQ